jgi:HAD superfamily hydrolase (TIGR01549 family)
MPPETRSIHLVIFDMDGTLTEERLDFAAIRRDIGVPPDTGVLEHIRRLEGPEKARAEEILHAHEIIAAECCKPHAGVTELLAALAARGIRRALLTRNSPASAKRVLQRHRWTFDYVATREDVPHKPHADSVLNIVRRFNVLREQTLMVGDYLYDLQAARAAGVAGVLILHKPGPLPDFASLATHVVRSLGEILALVATDRIVK